MRSRLARLRALVDRYRVDRRLPPPVRDLLVTTTRLRLRERRRSVIARVRPVVGTLGRDAAALRWRDRRLAVTRPLPTSFDELAIATADRVETAFAAADIEAFLVGRDGDVLELGLALDDRERALDVLADVARDGDVLQWFDRSHDGLVDLRSATGDRRARYARSWVVFTAHRWGDSATGPAGGVRVAFWQLGTSGERELVGTRSHARFHPDTDDSVETVAGRSFRSKTVFPVSTSLETFRDPIDVVVTWVDGADPTWQRSFRDTAAAEGRGLAESALDPARYRSRDELRYALRSVWANCGWVRHIWVVTAGQRPDWLAEDSSAHGVTVVDHSAILPEDALPTFNSHAIEASLHHIDGLREHFVYFNDDMFVARPLRPESFFTPNGLPRVFQGGAPVHGVESGATLAVDTAARRGRELLASRYGGVMRHKPLHAPYPNRRSTLLEIDREFADVICQTRHSRFRSPSDLSVAASFGPHYGFASGRAVLGEIAGEYVHVESGRLPWHLDRIRFGDDVDTFCINETQNGIGRSDREELVARHLRACFPVAAPWERDA